MSNPHYFKAPERTPIELMDRVYGADRELITQDSVGEITYEVWSYPTREDAVDALNGTVVGEDGSLEVDAVIFDTLQTDPPWSVSKDAVGYNFRFTLPAARRPSGRLWHRVQIWLTPEGETEPFPLVWIIETTPLAGD
jgi:hypothetical protein